MKSPFLLLSLLFTCCSIASAAEVQGKVTSYGLFKVSAKGKSAETPQTPTGVTQVIVIENTPENTPVLTTSTNRIPAKIGVQFGMWFELTNVPAKDGEVDVTAIVKHPAITKPDGTSQKGFTVIEKLSVKDGRVVSWSGYGFEYDYELVTGDWEFEIQFKGKTACKQKFTVFKE